MSVKYQFFLFFIFIPTSMFSATGVYAQTAGIRAERVTATCERVTLRVATLTARYDQNKAKHIQRYQNIKTILANLADRLEKKNFDVSKLRSQLKTFDDYIVTFGNNYTKFIDELNKSKSYACGQSQGDYKQSITAARAELKNVREQAKKIIEFVRNDIRPTVSELKNQKSAL